MAAQRRRASPLRGALVVAGSCLLLLGAAAYLAPRALDAWDFRTFYFAATAAARGLNPYDASAVSAVAGEEQFPYIYPPATLVFFYPFSRLGVQHATLLWLGLKLGLAIALLLLWRRSFLGTTGWIALLAVTLFGFNGSLLMDLRSGNISVLEQLALWLGFAAYCEGRRWRFAVLVSIASAFKLFPAAFLALLLVPLRRKGTRTGPVLVGLALVALWVAIPPAWGTRWVTGFLASSSIQRPMGEINPCALG